MTNLSLIFLNPFIILFLLHLKQNHHHLKNLNPIINEYYLKGFYLMIQELSYFFHSISINFTLQISSIILDMFKKLQV
jgi:hypothetical protein